MRPAKASLASATLHATAPPRGADWTRPTYSTEPARIRRATGPVNCWGGQQKLLTPQHGIAGPPVTGILVKGLPKVIELGHSLFVVAQSRFCSTRMGTSATITLPMSA